VSALKISLLEPLATAVKAKVNDWRSGDLYRLSSATSALRSFSLPTGPGIRKEKQFRKEQACN
jgi:hypothetical protein